MRRAPRAHIFSGRRRMLRESGENLRQAEFIAFSAILFIGKSLLLVRLPYRPVNENALYTFSILAAFYLYFRFRQGIAPPAAVIILLAAAVAVDVLGNYFHLYGRQFGPVQFDEFSHFVGSGCSLPPVMWMLRATLRRWGYRLPLKMVGFLAVCVAFSFSAYYEILELWDELFFGGKRLWSPRDTPNDLQYDLGGIILAAIATGLVFKLQERAAEP